MNKIFKCFAMSQAKRKAKKKKKKRSESSAKKASAIMKTFNAKTQKGARRFFSKVMATIQKYRWNDIFHCFIIFFLMYFVILALFMIFNKPSITFLLFWDCHIVTPTSLKLWQIKLPITVHFWHIVVFWCCSSSKEVYHLLQKNKI